MKHVIRKTDSRFTGADRFKYYVRMSPEFSESAIEEFFRLRVWCWETWGPAREVSSTIAKDYIANKFTDDLNDNWSWLNDDYRARIYLKGKDEVAMFRLRWGM